MSYNSPIPSPSTLLQLTVKDNLGYFGIDSTQSLEIDSSPLYGESLNSGWLLKNNNTLRVQVGLDTKSNIKAANHPENLSVASANGDEELIDYCEVEHIPLQRWTNVNVSLTNNDTAPA